MKIWEAYTSPDYYHIYFDILVAKGFKKSEAIEHKEHFRYYINARIKKAPFINKRLESCTTKQEIIEVFDDLFNNLWRDHFKYPEVQKHFYLYLDFLDSVQALLGKFFNEEEKNRLIGTKQDMPLKELTKYENEFLVNGKLVALMNPHLLYYLKSFVEDRNYSSKLAAKICCNFYGDLLPNMEISDYAKLIDFLWPRKAKNSEGKYSKTVRKGKMKKKIMITYPDGHSETFLQREGFIEFVKFYDFKLVLKKNLKIEGEKLLLTRIGELEQKYQKVGEAMYIYIRGGLRERDGIMRTLNAMMGRKLKYNFI